MVRLTTLLLVAASVSGCTLSQYARQADRAAYGTISSGQEAALGSKPAFDVTYHPLASQTTQPATIRVGEKDIPLAGGAPVKLTLFEALEVACRNSRSFQNRKETLYAQGLALANEQRSWTAPLLDGSADAEGSWSRTGKAGHTTKSTTASVGPTLTQRLAHGGVLALAATLDFATDLLGSQSTVVGSLLEANFTQPLLRGAWRDFAYEDLYRIERNFLFAVFDYERFTQTFAADIVRRYYNVLQLRDLLENE